MTEALNPLTFPLWGSRLIEASAGTGKTWTIAALYLRLVLGHGEEGTAHVRPLSPSEILVLTFTRAATRELSDRIRSRLLDALRCFRGEAAPGGDTLLAALLDHYPPGPARSAAAWRLAAAAEGMDDAAVFTIDAWCQRMLREHAFDSGSLFDEELVPDDSELRNEAVRDHWRQQVYPLSPEGLDVVLSVWSGVDKLAADMRSMLRHAPVLEEGRDSLGALVASLSGTFHAEREAWAERAETMRAWLNLQCDGKRVDARKLRPQYFDPWIDTLKAWAPTPDALRDALKTGAHRLTPEGLAEVAKAGTVLDVPPEFDAFAKLMATPPWSPSLRLHAAAHVSSRLQWLKKQSGHFGFDDMLARLDAALAGPNGDKLRSRILTQYPVALIDEFQDTSPVQYRLFDQVYRTAGNDPASALLLIGDPKQSIYGFRGADIHSYLAARRATEGRHYVLDTNHRSTAAAVSAVNHLFDLAEQRAGGGAFLLRDAVHHPLPFVPVQAKGRAEQFVTARGPVPAAELCVDAELRDGGSSQRRFAALCAEQIVAWLDDPAAGFQQAGEPFKRLRPADIAVLVRTGREASAVRRELRRRRVMSVFLSDRDSVFASTEAADLLRWLRAVSSPLDARLARAALATATMSRTLAELVALADDDVAFDERTMQLRELHKVWLTQGVLAMLRQTLHLLALPARWLRHTDGERRLTNVLHLAELLQTASSHLDNEHALIRWFAARVDDGEPGGDDQIVRLESDADLVKVVTVHKSKGLEYPVVLLPFVCAVKAESRSGDVVFDLVGDNGAHELHLRATPELSARADQDRLREDLRLLYVGLTRARHALWVGVAALRVGNAKTCVAHRSAFGYLMTGPDPVTAEGLVAAIGDMAGGHPHIRLTAAAADPLRTKLQRRDAHAPLVDAPPYDAHFDRRWSIASFSAIVRHIGSVPLSTLASVVREDEALSPDDGHTLLPAVVASPWHTFPRGAIPGNFLHDQLEWLADEQFGLARSPALQQQLQRRCERQGWGHRADDVRVWLTDLVSRPLPPLGVPLDALATRLPEMEFWFPTGDLPTTDIDRLCQRHLLNGAARPALPPRQLRGLVMGFADLVFCHEGRYWVLDYKSNALGLRDADYHPAALEAAMAAHRYDVQAALYLLALHRLLKARLGSQYDPATQLGGAIYLFLRGVHGPAGGCHVVPPDIDFLDALDHALGLVEAAP